MQYSIIFTNIETNTCKKLLELYENEEKQIFITFDHYDKFSCPQPILSRNIFTALLDEPFDFLVNNGTLTINNCINFYSTFFD